MMATCNFKIDQSIDYWILKLDDLSLDPFSQTWEAKCLETFAINIRGYGCNDTSVITWQVRDSDILHVDSEIPSTSYETCGCYKYNTGAVISEDNFGYYGVTNPAFSCTHNDSCTTQWWFGNKMNPSYVL